jgi:RNA 2',3'-cyclic 3'-phosphodiesterase
VRQRAGFGYTLSVAQQLSVRAFLAIPVTPPALAEGALLLDRLRSALPDVRWVRTEGLHLTLHFFASLGDGEVDTVVRAAGDAAVRASPFTAQVGGLGCFPRDGDERVLWVGTLAGSAETAALQADVERNLEAAGFAREARAFAPHVTLGRPRTRFTDAHRRRWREFAGEALPPFTVATVRLYRSHPGPGGSRYEVLATLPLGARSAG